MGKEDFIGCCVKGQCIIELQVHTWLALLLSTLNCELFVVKHCVRNK